MEAVKQVQTGEESLPPKHWAVPAAGALGGDTSLSLPDSKRLSQEWAL